MFRARAGRAVFLYPRSDKLAAMGYIRSIRWYLVTRIGKGSAMKLAQLNDAECREGGVGRMSLFAKRLFWVIVIVAGTALFINWRREVQSPNQAVDENKAFAARNPQVRVVGREPVSEKSCRLILEGTRTGERMPFQFDVGNVRPEELPITRRQLALLVRGDLCNLDVTHAGTLDLKPIVERPAVLAPIPDPEQ